MVKEDTPLEICTHVLAVVAIPLKLNTAYHARSQGSFATDVNLLSIWITGTNLNIRQTKDMLR